MPTSVDELQIELNAKATSANDAIDKLIGKLDKLSTSLGKLNGSGINGVANGIDKLGKSMQTINSINSKSFTRLADNIQKLGNINVYNLNSSASALSNITRAFNQLGGVTQNAQQVGVLASNLSKLGNKTVVNATQNIPQLANSINYLMKVLSKAPVVSQNVISLVNSLASFTSQGAKVGSSSSSIVRGLNNIGSTSSKTSKKVFSLASAFGSLYANFFWVIRGIKGVWNSIGETSDYIESFNYYTVAFDKIASEWDDKYESYGTENAKKYTNAFVTEMSDSFSKLSGLKLNLSDDLESGILSDTGMKNLGLNIREVTQYASQLASVTNSVGQTGKVSLMTADAFTKLAADMSSLFNVDFSTVANNLQSGLIGQSRALYKYGIDITNATLQTYAYKMGLEKAVSEMTQMEKMQLRMIAILDQSKVSWGDLADTINTPANMIRQLSNNFKEASMVLGQLFMPLLTKVLPVINGVVIAIKNLLVSMASFVGVDISLDNFGSGVTESTDDMLDFQEGMDAATSSAKKLKNQLQGFDKLNNLTTANASNVNGAIGGTIDLSSQIQKATEEYQKAWNEAYANMESKAQGFAKNIEKALAPIKNIFNDLVIGDYFAVGQDVTNLVVGINEFLTKAISNVDWKQVGENIGLFIRGIDFTKILSSVGRLIWEGINAGIDIWKGMFNVSPIETTILTAIASVFVGLPLLSNITKALSPIIASLSGMFAEGGVFGAGGLIASASTPILVVTGALSLLAAGLGIVYAKNEEVRESFSNAVSIIGENLKPLLEVFTDEILPDLQSGWDKLFQVFKPLGEFLETVFVSIWQDMLNPALKYLGEKILPILTEALSNLWNNVFVPLGNFIGSVLSPIIDLLSKGFTFLWTNVVVPLANALGNILGKAFEGIFAILNKTIIPVVNMVINVFQFLWNNVLYPIVRFISNTFAPVFQTVFDTMGGLIDGLSKTFGGLIDFITGVFTLDWEKAWNGVKDIFKGIFNGLISIVEGIVNFIIGGLNAFLKGFNGIVTSVGDVIGIDISIPKIKKISIQRFETGGFPEDGWFRASKGEYFGSFDDGTSVIANNNQIISGISNGVKSANAEQNALLREQNALLRQILAKDTGISTRDIFNAVRSENRDYINRNGESAFAY